MKEGVVPEGAVEAFAQELYEDWGRKGGVSTYLRPWAEVISVRRQFRLEARERLKAAAAHIRQALLEELRRELLGDEALRAFNQDFIDRVWAEDDMPALLDYRRAMEAALDALNTQETSR
jgi:hypothetical protein